MKQIAILSGKGGTGKTTVAGAFIRLSDKKAFADCDVDAPNLHLIFNREEKLLRSDYHGLKKAVKYEENCLDCRKCESLCRFGAIHNGRVNQFECEGCGVCEYFCTAGIKTGVPAIRLEDNISGHTQLSKVDGQIFSHAELKMGNGASGKLVTEVRKILYKNIKDEEIIIIDGSPGIGCPVIASITGVDMVLIVTEPTLSGLHDLQRISQTAKRFGVPCLVCVNKHDLNPDITKNIEEYCMTEGIRHIGNVPYDSMVPLAMNSGKSIVEFADCDASKAITQLWLKVFECLNQ